MRSLLIITGTMGAGKTSVLGEASDILARRQVGHAAIDVDALGLSYWRTTTRNDEAMYGKLRSVCNNYAALGVTRFLLARALENYYELDMCWGIVFATDTTVCRLTANIGTMERRVTVRESGLARQIGKVDCPLDVTAKLTYLHDGATHQATPLCCLGHGNTCSRFLFWLRRRLWDVLRICLAPAT